MARPRCTTPPLAATWTVVLLLLGNGADVTAKDYDGATPLHHAASEDQEAGVLLLIDRGAEVSAQDDDGSTPLHFAASHGRVAVVSLSLSLPPSLPPSLSLSGARPWCASSLTRVQGARSRVQGAGCRV